MSDGVRGGACGRHPSSARSRPGFAANKQPGRRRGGVVTRFKGGSYMAPTSFRILKTLAISAVASLAVMACGGNGGGGNGNLASDQTLNFPILGDFGTLDPAVADAETDQEIQQNFQDGLVRFDKDLNIVPDLATAVPTASSDGLTYVFKLRQDAMFSNGDKFTAKDVLFSWNRAVAYQGSYATNLSAIVGYDVVAKNKKAGKELEAINEK